MSMTYRNKTYVSFDADKDMRYYNLMRAWRDNDNMPFYFHDAHDINNLREWSNEETIKGKLRDRLNNSKLFILLVWESTKFLYKFVRREIEEAIKLWLPIIVVNLNWIRKVDKDNCPPIARDTLSLHVSFHSNIIIKAMRERPSLDAKFRWEWITTSYYYEDHVYQSLWINE